jgi:hypothetical protein
MYEQDCDMLFNLYSQLIGNYRCFIVMEKFFPITYRNTGNADTQVFSDLLAEECNAYFNMRKRHFSN